MTSPSAHETKPSPEPPRRLPTIDDVLAARARISPRILRTPILSTRSLGAEHGARLFLKPENLQRAGSFKIRGALNAVFSALEAGAIGPAGVVTYSSGNHGQATALAAQLAGSRATVVVPEDIVRVKRQGMEAHAATIIPCGRSSDERMLEAHRLAAETGACLVHPYDDPLTMSGQATLALEILEDSGALDAVIVPVGGGGLIGGISLAIKALRPLVKVIGVEPSGADDMARSLAAGHRISLPPSSTVADGLRALQPGVLPFEAARRFVDEIWRVEDEEIREAQWRLLDRAKLFVEPSGAVPLAAFSRHGASLRGKTVVLLLSGGNADPRTLGGRA